MSDSKKHHNLNPYVEITVKDGTTGSHNTAVTTSSSKPRAFITQPRTGSGSKFSQMSENYSVGMSTTLDGKYQMSSAVVPSHSGTGMYVKTLTIIPRIR